MLNFPTALKFPAELTFPPMWWLLPTILVYFASRALAKKVRHPLCNPLLLSLVALISCLSYTKTSYETYFEQNQLLHIMLGPVVVALAYPLYEQLATIRQHWRVILISCLSASVCSMVLGTSLAFAFGADATIAASVLPKSVSTPFAINVAEQVDGIPAISAALVAIAGIFGALFGYPLLKLMGIRSAIAKGLTIGSVSHAIGTAKAAESSFQEGALSSLALVICGVVTAMLAPAIFKIMLMAMSFFAG